MNQPYQVILQFRQHSAHLSETEQDEHYQVEVIEAPGRGWGGPMQASGLDEDQIRAIRMAYRGFIVRQQSSDAESGEWTLHPLRVMGNQLFLALPETVQARLHEAQSIAQKQGRSLELVLIFENNAQSLLELPWELLHHPQGHFFFALRGGSVTRRLPLSTAPKGDGEFRLQGTLGVWAEPRGLETLAERGRWQPAPGKGESITWIQGPDSLRQLQHALEVDDFDSLHIVAHGRIGPQWNFALALEDEEGSPHWLTPDQLATFIGDYPRVRFIYLDICGSSDYSDDRAGARRSGTTPGGMAVSLLGAGLSAVVVMQDRIGQAAAGLMASVFYRELADGATLATAMARARRTVRLEQRDIIHWSVPVLYTQQPSTKEMSLVVDWPLDRVTRPTILTAIFLLFVLGIMIGRLSYALAQVNLNDWRAWGALPALLLECELIPILVVAMTTLGQRQLQEKYNLHGGIWLPVLQHKYFSALLWSFFAWGIIWLGWLGLYWSGIGDGLTTPGRQVLWVVGLLSVGLAAHVGAQQAIRQNLLFLRVGFRLFQSSLVDTVVILFFLLFAPFLPLLLLWPIWLLWSIVGAPTNGLGPILSGALALMAAFLHLIPSQRKA